MYPKPISRNVSPAAVLYVADIKTMVCQFVFIWLINIQNNCDVIFIMQVKKNIYYNPECCIWFSNKISKIMLYICYKQRVDNQYENFSFFVPWIVLQLIPLFAPIKRHKIKHFSEIGELFRWYLYIVLAAKINKAIAIFRWCTYVYQKKVRQHKFIICIWTWHFTRLTLDKSFNCLTTV